MATFSGVPSTTTVPPPSPPTIAKLDGRNLAEERSVKSILKELNAPPVKKSQTEGLIRFEALPPFQAEALGAYPVDNTPTPLRDASSISWVGDSRPSDRVEWLCKS